MAREVVIGKQYYEILKQLYNKYLTNKDNYKLKESSRHEIDPRNCPFCRMPSISGFIEMNIDPAQKYHIHIDCIEDGWISLLEEELNQTKTS